MKKKIFILSIMTLFLININNAYALEKETGRIATTVGVNMRTGPGTNYDKAGKISYNTIVNVISHKESGNGCNSEWLEVTYENNNQEIKGFVCSDFIEDIKKEEVTEKTEEENKEEVKEEVKEEEN